MPKPKQKNYIFGILRVRGIHWCGFGSDRWGWGVVRGFSSFLEAPFQNIWDTFTLFQEHQWNAELKSCPLAPTDEIRCGKGGLVKVQGCGWLLGLQGTLNPNVPHLPPNSQLHILKNILDGYVKLEKKNKVFYVSSLHHTGVAL
mgnify:CR=1 FL=1